MALIGGRLGRLLNKLFALLKRGKEAGVFDQNGNPIPAPGPELGPVQ